MGRYILFRIIRWIPAALLILFIVYAMAFYGAGDPIKLIFLNAPGDVAYDQDRIAAMEEALGLDRPFLVQFGDYLWHILHGDLGRSIITNRPVIDTVKNAAPVSLELGVTATIFLALVGIPFGTLAALHQNTLLDNVIVGVALFIGGIPVFVAGPLLIIFLVSELHLMHTPYGWNGPFSTDAILPVLVLALAPMSIIIRLTRTAVLEVLAEDYIRTARAKGLPERIVVMRHIIKPVLTPVVTQLGLIMIAMINGAILVETVFGIPGLGRLTVTSTVDVDYPVILAVTLIGTFLVMISNLFVDMIYPLLDPRAGQTQRGIDA